MDDQLPRTWRGAKQKGEWAKTKLSKTHLSFLNIVTPLCKTCIVSRKQYLENNIYIYIYIYIYI